MVLGAIILKLGMIGLFRITMFLGKIFYGRHVFRLILIWSICRFFFARMMALRCNDLKIVIAYSSIVHLAPVIMGLLLGSFEGIVGRVYMGVGHGVRSSALFLGIGLIYGIRGFRTRYFINVARTSTIFSFFWFFSCITNGSVPPSIKFFGEIFLFYSIFLFSKVLVILCLCGVAVSGVYSILLYTNLCHGRYRVLQGKGDIRIIKGRILLVFHIGLGIIFIFVCLKCNIYFSTSLYKIIFCVK